MFGVKWFHTMLSEVVQKQENQSSAGHIYCCVMYMCHSLTDHFMSLVTRTFKKKKNNILTLLHPSSIKYKDIYIHKILTIQFKGAFLSLPVRSRILFSSTSKNMHTVILLNILVQVSAGERLLFVFHLKQLNRIIEFLR